MELNVSVLARKIADGAWAELGPKIDAFKADWDAHRRALQARNTELVEENRRLRAELTAQRERGDALLADYWAVVDASRAAKARVCEACGLPTEWTMTKAGYRRCECPADKGGK